MVLIEVDESYRRQAIGKQIIKILEKKAREYGYKQIRAWSSEDKVEALNMWYSLNYCMCPAAMLGQSIKPGFENQKIIGYYYAKILN
jgi:ribosomal protein S18 acetylase RimI-like enzyme